jgi:hypothetical protein
MYEKFAELLTELTRRIPSKELALQLGIPPATLYKYRSGERNFPVELIAQLYLATSADEIFDFILRGTNLVVIKQPSFKDTASNKDKIQDLTWNLSRLLSLLWDYNARTGNRSRIVGEMKKTATLLLEFAESLQQDKMKSLHR